MSRRRLSQMAVHTNRNLGSFEFLSFSNKRVLSSSCFLLDLPEIFLLLLLCHFLICCLSVLQKRTTEKIFNTSLNSELHLNVHGTAAVLMVTFLPFSVSVSFLWCAAFRRAGRQNMSPSWYLLCKL